MKNNFNSQIQISNDEAAIHGIKYAARNRDYKIRLLEIQNKFPDFFKDRKDRLAPDMPDSLLNYAGAIYEFESVRLSLDPYSIFPQEIKEECIRAFNEVFGAE